MEFDDIFKTTQRVLKPGAWYWSFWLFFMKNPDANKPPLQLMILWSTKYERKLSCNDYEFYEKSLKKTDENKTTHKGMVAAWFFDGEKMHHNFILEKTYIVKDYKRKTMFIGEDIVFRKKENLLEVEINKKNFSAKFESYVPENGTEYKAKVGEGTTLHNLFTFRIARFDYLDLKAKINNKELLGSSYFQDVVVDSPVGPWYWGYFHFKDKSILSYFYVYFGNSLFKQNPFKIKKQKAWLPVDTNCYYYYAPEDKIYRFPDNLKVKMIGTDEKPVFEVVGKNIKEQTEIYLKVKTYSHSYWHFKGQILCLPIKSNFRYNEYPSFVDGYILDKKSNKKLEIKKGIGNSENSWGFFF